MIDLYEIVKEKQTELGLNNTELCKFLGMTRQWLVLLQYGKKRQLNKGTMYLLNAKLGISMDTLVDYNEQIRLSRLDTQESE